MDKPVEIVLTANAYGGEAIGRYNGQAVFVPFALAGEVIRARIVEEKKNFARAELLEVVKPSPRRITPRCRHFGTCGGCHYQFLPYEAQLELKTAILRDQFIDEKEKEIDRLCLEFLLRQQPVGIHLRFAFGAIKVNPVTFPPGRARLSTSPAATGSPWLTKRMGIALVAFLAARASGV